MKQTLRDAATQNYNCNGIFYNLYRKLWDTLLFQMQGVMWLESWRKTHPLNWYIIYYEEIRAENVMNKKYPERILQICCVNKHSEINSKFSRNNALKQTCEMSQTGSFTSWIELKVNANRRDLTKLLYLQCPLSYIAFVWRQIEVWISPSF